VNFTADEVEHIRLAAKAIPVGGRDDPGKAQVSSLVDLAEIATLETLRMELEARINAQKLTRDQAGALSAMLRLIHLTPLEKQRLPKGEHAEEQALMIKRANALRYVNKLRARAPQSQQRGDGRRSQQRHR